MRLKIYVRRKKISRKSFYFIIIIIIQQQHFFFWWNEQIWNAYEILSSVFVCSVLLSDNGLEKFIFIFHILYTKKGSFGKYYFFVIIKRDGIQQGEVININTWHRYLFKANGTVFFLLSFFLSRFSSCLLLFNFVYTSTIFATEQNTGWMINIENEFNGVPWSDGVLRMKCVNVRILFRPCSNTRLWLVAHVLRPNWLYVK